MKSEVAKWTLIIFAGCVFATGTIVEYAENCIDKSIEAAEDKAAEWKDKHPMIVKHPLCAFFNSDTGVVNRFYSEDACEEFKKLNSHRPCPTRKYLDCRPYIISDSSYQTGYKCVEKEECR